MLLVNKQCGIETLQSRKSETVVDQRRVRKFVTTVEHLLEVLTATALFCLQNILYCPAVRPVTE